MSYIVLDLETTVHNVKGKVDEVVGKDWASPFHPDNYIVAVGLKIQHSGVVTYGVSETGKACTGLLSYLERDDILVGHNIKFDLLYLMQKDIHFRNYVMENPIRIWDTALAEYLITAQQIKFPSLDYVAVKYGGTLKDSEISDWWAAGKDTEDIPYPKLVEYLKNDVENTELVFLDQLQKVDAMGMTPLVYSQMQALMCTTIMEHNGMYFDKYMSLSTADLMYDGMALIDHEFRDLVEDRFGPFPADLDLNISSNKHIAAIVYGGDVGYDYKENITDDDGNPVLFKTGPRKGTPRTRKVAKKFTFPNNPALTGHDTAVDAGTLTKLSVSTTRRKIIDKVLEYREIKKQQSTYFTAFSGLVHTDGAIHGAINHVGTETGRLSSSKPNMQNVTS